MGTPHFLYNNTQFLCRWFAFLTKFSAYEKKSLLTSWVGMELQNILSLIWCHTSLLLALIGNSFVIYSTVYHKAIKLDKLSVWIIQNLAVSDLIVNNICILVPVIISLYANNQWVLGDTFCKAIFMYKYAGCAASIFLINSLSLNKIMRCLFPLRNLDCSRRQRWSLTVITIIVAMILPIYYFYGAIVERIFIVDFSVTQCFCWSNQTAFPKSWHIIFEYFTTILLNGLPCLTLFLMNTFLVIYAVNKTNNPVNKTNIMIVILVTASFLISVLPYFIYAMLRGDSWDETDYTIRLVTFIMFLSFWTNPVIYFFANNHFRKLVINVVLTRRIIIVRASESGISTRRASDTLPN